MGQLSPKELKKLAAACRAAGIRHYKADGVEFTLTDEAPTSNYKKRASPSKINVEAPNSPITGTISSDGWSTLTEEQKLFYSVQDPLFEENESTGES